MNIFERLYFSLFLGKRFYQLGGFVIFIFVLSYFIPFLFGIGQILFLLLLLALVLDYAVLFSNRNPVEVQRVLPEKLFNGEENRISWLIRSHYSFNTRLQLVDEFPGSWQIRDFKLKFLAKPEERVEFSHIITPRERGEFFFGRIYLYAKTPLQLVFRRKAFPANIGVRVFPGFSIYRKLQFMTHITEPGKTGFKQVRKTGHSLEFEQIRDYVSGDDIRSVNWKATGRTGGKLMINNFIDEKSQQVYCIIDKGRTMKMAFDGLSLLDYAVNATLALSSIAISRQDKAGFISFGDKSGDFLPANHRGTQMNSIVQALCNLNTQFLESDFAFLHKLIKTRITQRSLIILFTNFESLAALGRQLPYMRNISRQHLLLVVFFENTSLEVLANGDAANIEQLYEKVIAEKFVLEKKLIVKELQRFGIAALLTAPEKLSIDVVNKYLQIKARREI